jgi:hypothetical protein
MTASRTKWISRLACWCAIAVPSAAWQTGNAAEINWLYVELGLGVIPELPDHLVANILSSGPVSSRMRMQGETEFMSHLALNAEKKN